MRCDTVSQTLLPFDRFFFFNLATTFIEASYLCRLLKYQNPNLQLRIAWLFFVLLPFPLITSFSPYKIVVFLRDARAVSIPRVW